MTLQMTKENLVTGVNKAAKEGMVHPVFTICLHLFTQAIISQVKRKRKHFFAPQNFFQGASMYPCNTASLKDKVACRAAKLRKQKVYLAPVVCL